MAINRIALIGLGVLGLTATITIALAQNTTNPMLSGNTVNPILSGNSVTLSAASEVPVSPALPNALLTPTIGRNAHTGLPCSGFGSLAVVPNLPGATTAPGSTGATTATQSGTSTIHQLPSFPSVFGSSPSC
jgi:hypothetical protein